MPYILALDEGTTSARAIVFAHDGSVRAVAQKELKQHYPKPGWVEHDAHEIWTSQMGVAVEALAKAIQNASKGDREDYKDRRADLSRKLSKHDGCISFINAVTG